MDAYLDQAEALIEGDEGEETPRGAGRGRGRCRTGAATGATGHGPSAPGGRRAGRGHGGWLKLGEQLVLLPSSIDTIAQQVPLCMPADLSRALQRDVSVRRARLHASAALLGWLDEATQWQILHHNAQRAADCFQGWQDFGTAFARGHHASATATIHGTGYPGRCRP